MAIYHNETRSMLWMLQEEVVVCNAFSDKNRTRRNDVKSRDVLPGLVLAQAELCNLLDWDKEKKTTKAIQQISCCEPLHEVRHISNVYVCGAGYAWYGLRPNA